MLKTPALVVLFVVACGGGTRKAVDTGGTASTAGALLALGELKLIDVNKDQALLIHADGTIELDGNKFAKVTADGKLISIGTGEVGLTLRADGAVIGSDGKDYGIKIGADGAATIRDMTLSIAPTGELVGGNLDTPTMRIEGATDDKLKRTAMFVLVVMSISSEAKPETP